MNDSHRSARPAARLLVAVDMDGTLLDTETDDRLQPRALAALEAVRQAGHVVAICTGRNRRSLVRLLERSGWHPPDLPMVLLNGAVVDGAHLGLLAHNTLARPELANLVQLFRSHGAVPMIYGSDELLLYEHSDVNPVLARYLEHRRLQVGGLERYDDLLSALPTHALEVGTIDVREVIMRLSEAIRDELGDRVKVINTRSLLGEGAFFWAEVYHPACSKGAGVQLLAERLAIAPRHIIAIGDNYNDLDMFEVAAVSISMQGGPADVVAAADRVAGPVSEHGAAAVLEDIAAGIFALPAGDREAS